MFQNVCEVLLLIDKCNSLVSDHSDVNWGDKLSRNARVCPEIADIFPASLEEAIWDIGNMKHIADSGRRTLIVHSGTLT